MKGLDSSNPPLSTIQSVSFGTYVKARKVRNMNGSKGKTPPHLPRFQTTVERLIHEIYNLRGTFAAMRAAQGQASCNLFVQVASAALQSDLLIRLIRIFEDGEAASFWYLHRCEPRKVRKGINIEKLADFSARLKAIRDKVFVHIDKDAVFEPQKVYQDAGIKPSEIKEAIEAAWKVLNELYSEQSGKPFRHSPQSSLDSLTQDFQRDFAELSER
jgi:hypothetical protein